MKNTFFIILLLVCFKSIGQQKRVKTYNYNGEEIKYSRIDYSKYGIIHVFVTMYEENFKNKLIEKKSESILNSEKNLYHTLYFFIEIPQKFSFEEKEKIFNEIMKEIEKKEKLKTFDLYLNFDLDYSEKYQLEVLENNKLNKVKRIFTDINSENIDFGLSIQR